ncbi:hypothetical protein K438DRAFT_667678 [Mycena galopus ATCC 62051]|nr:hypothetical protein K438DRAFT_667678 [Mycena galopus ATCC 62051]
MFWPALWVFLKAEMKSHRPIASWTTARSLFSSALPVPRPGLCLSQKFPRQTQNPNNGSCGCQTCGSSQVCAKSELLSTLCVGLVLPRHRSRFGGPPPRPEHETTWTHPSTNSSLKSM